MVINTYLKFRFNQPKQSKRNAKTEKHRRNYLERDETLEFIHVDIKEDYLNF